MTPEVWVSLAVAVTSFLGALGAYLRSRTTQSQLATHVALCPHSKPLSTDTPPPAA